MRSVRGHSVIEFSNPINFVAAVDAAKAEEEGEEGKASIVEMTQANANARPPTAPASEKKKAAKKKKKRRTCQPPQTRKCLGRGGSDRRRNALLLQPEGEPHTVGKTARVGKIYGDGKV